MSDPASDSESFTTTRVLALADRLAYSLAVARALARGGRQLDLSGLPECVGQLCALALDLPPSHGRLMLPTLTALAASLDRLNAVFGATETDRHAA